MASLSSPLLFFAAVCICIITNIGGFEQKNYTVFTEPMLLCYLFLEVMVIVSFKHTAEVLCFCFQCELRACSVCCVNSH